MLIGATTALFLIRGRYVERDVEYKGEFICCVMLRTLCDATILIIKAIVKYDLCVNAIISIIKNNSKLWLVCKLRCEQEIFSLSRSSPARARSVLIRKHLSCNGKHEPHIIEKQSFWCIPIFFDPPLMTMSIAILNIAILNGRA